jgi:O-antigen/teichoic acid export membrane protein
MWGDNAIVGRYLGVHDLGIYRTGVVFVSLTFGLVLNPLLPILYPAFSRLQGDPCAVRDAFHKVNGLVCAIALPVGVGLLLTGSDLSRALFGAKWEGLGLVIGLLGLKDAVVWTVTVNGELYRAIGRPDLNTRLLVLFCCVFLPAYVLLAPLGIRAFTWGRACLALLTVPIHILVAVRLLRLSPFYLWRQARPSILATVLMAAAVYGAGLVLGSVFPRLPAAPRLGVLIATGVLTYGAAVWGLAPRMVSDAWRRFAREGASA